MEIGRSGFPVLDQYSEDGFIDCVFFVGHAGVHGERRLFELRAECDGEVVGMDVDMLAMPEPGFDAAMHVFRDHVYRGGVVLHSAGPPSDRLIAALARRYRLGAFVGLAMAASVQLTMIVLQQSIAAGDGPVRMKLFGGDGAGQAKADYFESFFNLDLAAGRAFWKEKDLDYREPMLRALSGG
ncbi:MAG: hypothetical protein ACREO3_04030 [Arenimonas sp.]